MKIRRFEKEDLSRLEMQEVQKHEALGLEYPKDKSFTIEDDGVVLGVFGVTEIYKGRAVVFSFISQKAGKGMLGMIKTLRKMIDDGMEKTGVERLEMSVLEGFEHGDRFAIMLGFEFEGVMRKYYKGKNYKLYARVK